MAVLEVSPTRAGMTRFLDEVEGHILRTVVSRSLQLPYPLSAVEMLDREVSRRGTGLEVADLLIARDLVRALLDDDLVRKARSDRRDRYREEGHRGKIKTDKRWVTVRLPHGLQLRVKTDYMLPTRKGLVGRPRGNGKRRAGGVGTYPVLAGDVTGALPEVWG